MLNARAYHLEIDDMFNLLDETLRAHECQILQSSVMFIRENLVDGKGRFEFTLDRTVRDLTLTVEVLA